MKSLQYKLIVTDLDGTLVKSGTNEISHNTIEVIKALKERGIHFTIATGRSWKQAKAITQYFNPAASDITGLVGSND